MFASRPLIFFSRACYVLVTNETDVVLRAWAWVLEFTLTDLTHHHHHSSIPNLISPPLFVQSVRWATFYRADPEWARPEMRPLV